MTRSASGLHRAAVSAEANHQSDGGPLRDIALALIGSQAFFALLYMGGASASDLARIIASWKKP